MSTNTIEKGAYFGDPAIKAKYLSRVANHRAADSLVQGTGWENGKGCAVGCTLENYNHTQYPIELGVPIELAYLEDLLFERLKPADAQLWPEQFLDAITPGADLSLVWPKFTLWTLTDEKWGVIAKVEHDDTKTYIKAVAAIYEEWIRSGEPPAHGSPVDVAAQAARDAWAARAARDARDAWAARDARAARAAWAARAARDAWAARDARDAYVLASRDKFIELLKEAPQVKN